MRTDWTRAEIADLFDLPFTELIFRAAKVHRTHSIFTGDKLLTAANAGDDKDVAMFAKLGLKPLEAEEPMRVEEA